MKVKRKFLGKLNRQMSVLIFFVAMILTVSSCSFFASMKDDEPSKNSEVSISSLAVGKSTLEIKVGAMDYISVSVKPQSVQKNVSLSWTYDKSIIECDTSSNWGVTIKGLAEGQTSLKCSYGGYDATCLITVSGYEEGYEITTDPYIYSNTQILQTSPGVSEKVFVSLYGGDASDIDGYTWTVDNSSVASIQPTGQYCIITAKDSGYSRIKVTHKKAAYPYYIGVYVFDDVTNVTYITTQNNILTMNKDDADQEIQVSLVNGKDSSLDSNFSWQIINQESAVVPVEIQYNGNKAVITPVASGSCTLRVSHPDAVYPLDILCRVITIVKNVYIKPDSTVAYLDGSTEQTVTSSLENIDVSEYSLDDYSYNLENYNVAEIVSYVGNQVMLRGKANGSTKLIISHSKAAYTREVLLIVTGQLTDAVDASCYITTNQNYIRTKVGADATSVSVSLKGGEDGDENGFVWSVKSTPTAGTNDVILLETTNGTAVHSRAAASTFAYGNAHITPKAEGTAVITVSHPKIVYPTEILVKVLSEDAILSEPLYFTGSGILHILNGETQDYTLSLAGKNKTVSDNAGISWSIDDRRLTVVGNENVARITAPAYGTGCTISHLTAKHSKADSDKTVVVLTADDEETLYNMKALYSDKLYYNFEVGKTVTVSCSSVGFEDKDSDEAYDWSLFKWTVSDPTILSVEKDSVYPLNCVVTGLKSGSAKLTGSITDSGSTYSCEFTITVYPVGAVQTEPEIYFTTTQNVVSMGEGNSSQVSVTAVNLNSIEYSNIAWTIDNNDIASIVPNGTTATVTAKAEGETIIHVSHPDSQNSLKIYVRVGSEYVIPETDPVVYISAQDVITMLRDDQAEKLQAVLVNYSGTDTSGFTFEIDDERVAKIAAQSKNGTAYIKPVGSGQAEITISHTKTQNSKKVLVVVGNSAEELAGFTYLTTSSNVVAIGEGNTKSVSVSVKNSENVVVDGYTWTSSNPSCVDVTSSGATAVLTGNSIGTAIITVTNTNCKYSLQIIAQCVDPIAAAANPYIQLTSSVMTLTVGNSYNPITADLVGGTESDYSDFVWSTNDSKIAVVYGQNEVGKIRAMSSGTTYITVSHPKAAYSAQLLVVCDEQTTSECYISVPSSIINMKPTDSSQTITASLVNGTTTDKYNFSWSLDVYDIIDFQYSANVCTITPKQTGSVTITISHPKAAYDQQVIVNVQQYSEFAFPYEYLTITQGDVRFVSMEVPTTNVTTHIEYYVGDPSNKAEKNNILSIQGTKSTAQITAAAAGTTTVTAKLIATSSNVVQATSEMMVYVKEKELNSVYITSSSTITTVNKGKAQTLSAMVTGAGVVTSDQQNLLWTTSDSDIVQVTGIGSDGSVKGQSIYITALKSGEAIITCSHPKAASNLQFYVVVPGTEEQIVSLNKTYVTITKGSSGTQVKATISNLDSLEDYNSLVWTCDSVNGEEIVRLMGGKNDADEVVGQTVTLYPVNVGETKLKAKLPNGKYASMSVVVEAGKSFQFGATSASVVPFSKKIINYTISPVDAARTWLMNQEEEYFSYRDLGVDEKGNGSVEISGLNVGSGVLVCKTDKGSVGNLNINVSWNYSFNAVGKSSFTTTPDKTETLTYTVQPSDAIFDIQVSDTSACKVSHNPSAKNDGTGTFEIIGIGEASNIDITIKALNPNNNNELIGQKNIRANFVYTNDQYDIKTSFQRDDGEWSNWNETASVLELGDGETVTMVFESTLPLGSKTLSDISYTPTNGITVTPLWASADHKKLTVTIAHEYDYAEKQYYVSKAYIPEYSCKPINEWKKLFFWELDHCFHSGRDCDCYFGLIFSPDGNPKSDMGCHKGTNKEDNGEDNAYLSLTRVGGGEYGSKESAVKTFSVFDENDRFSKKETTAYNGYYDKEEFESYAWWYCPGTSPERFDGLPESESITCWTNKHDWTSVCSPAYKYRAFENANDCGGITVSPMVVNENVTATLVDSINTGTVSSVTVGDKTYNNGGGGKFQVSIKGCKQVDVNIQLRIRKCNKSYK